MDQERNYYGIQTTLITKKNKNTGYQDSYDISKTYDDIRNEKGQI